MPIRPRLTGFVNGCFDNLHAGHILLLQTAANYCDQLWIAVNTDEYIRRTKGAGRPVQSLGARLQAVSNARFRLPCASCVVILEEDTPGRLLARIKPDVYVIGSDYRGRQLPGAEFCQRVLFVERLPDISTTENLRHDRRLY